MDVNVKQRLYLETYVVTFGGFGVGFATHHLRRRLQ